MEEQAWLTTNEVADRYGVTKATVINWIKAGHVVGEWDPRLHRWLVAAESLQNFEPPARGRPWNKERE